MNVGSLSLQDYLHIKNEVDLKIQKWVSSYTY